MKAATVGLNEERVSMSDLSLKRSDVKAIRVGYDVICRCDFI